MKKLNDIQIETDNQKSERLNFAFRFKAQKKYIFSKISRYIKGNALEVGSGVGGNLNFIQKYSDSLHAIEPSKITFKELKKNQNLGKIHKSIILHNLYLKNLKLKFDTILYIDVLEHIYDDHFEIESALNLLNSKGRIIILCPAYNFLYSNEFDKNVGHFRRYNSRLFKKLAKKNQAKIESIFFIDSCGFFLSLLNKFVFKKNDLSVKTLWFYNNIVIPISSITDKIFSYKFGKSIIMILSKS